VSNAVDGYSTCVLKADGLLRRWASAILDAMPKGDDAAARRAFEEVDAMLTQAQKLTPNDPDVKRLLARAQELRSARVR